MKYILTTCIALLLIFEGQLAAQTKTIVKQAQGNTFRPVWTKNVTRRVGIDFLSSGRVDSTRIVAAWTGFFQLLDTMLRSGAVKGMNNYDFKPLKKDDIDVMTGTRLDTIVVVDPVTGKEMIKLLKSEFDFATIGKIRFMEKWTYDEQTGKTTVQIEGVSPMQDVFTDGDYRGSRSLYWISWSELQKVCSHYKQADMLKNITAHLWGDYFRDSAIVYTGTDDAKAGAGLCSRTVVRLTHAPVSDEPEYPMNLVANITADMSIAELLYRNAEKGGMAARADNGLQPGAQMSIAQLKESTIQEPDTVLMTDPVTGEEMMKIIHHDFCFECMTAFCVSEHWSFDAAKGVTTIDYTNLAPAKDIMQADGTAKGFKALWWYPYTSSREILVQYNAAHPRSSIEWNLWEDRFRERRHRGN